MAALAADAPEITAAITALATREQRVGVGVVLGSNVFNLAALLGLGAVVAGRIVLHRKVVALSGAVALWVSVVCLITVTGIVDSAAGLVLVLAVLVPYVVLLAYAAQSAGGFPSPARGRPGWRPRSTRRSSSWWPPYVRGGAALGTCSWRSLRSSS